VPSEVATKQPSAAAILSSAVISMEVTKDDLQNIALGTFPKIPDGIEPENFVVPVLAAEQTLQWRNASSGV
jgi:hypothetical protein